MSTGNLRARKPTDGVAGAGQNANNLTKNVAQFVADGAEKVKNPPDRRLLSVEYWFFLIIYLILAYIFAFWTDAWLPEPLTPEQAGSELFSEVRAWGWLVEMANYGPKPAGSHAADVLTKNFILKKLEESKAKTKTEFHKLEVDVQQPMDCWEFHFITPYISCYKNITNIVARLTPKIASNFSVLINCHFDSAPSSPGATDDLAGCAAMLEILSILSQSENSLKHNIIFLFNGAEENFMQASHGFITKHKWRHEIRAFINLEGAGAGGREFLFQQGPANTWLLHAYLDSARWPHGSILAQEVFESGILISDTDFRVFKDYGRLSGLDFAYIRNGYLYHTEFDNVDFITPGSIQRLGDNIFETIKTIANSDCLATYCPEKEDRVLFFDVLGLFVVQYKRKYATIFNYFVCLLVVLKIYLHCRDSTKDEERLARFSSSGQFRSVYQDVAYTFNDFCQQFGLMLASLLTCALILFVQSQMVWIFNLTMFWYSSWLLLLPVYIVPSIIAGFSVHIWAGFSLRKKREKVFQMEQVTFDCSLFIFCLMLFALTVLGVQSTYFVLIHLVFPLLRDSVLLSICKFKNRRRSASLLFTCHVLSVFPPVVIGMYALVEVLHVFLPMMGRSGAVLYPEYLIAAICFLICLSTTLFFSNLVYITKDIKWLINWAAVFCIISFIWLSFPGVCEPFKFSTSGPRWRRLHTQHIRRRYPISPDNSQMVDESGVWLAPLDYRGVKDLPEMFLESGAVQPTCVKVDGYCGLPYYLPARRYLKPNVTMWLPTPDDQPRFSKPVSIKVLDKKRVDKTRLVLTISIDGADHISGYFTPLNSWNIDYLTFNGKTVSVPADQDTTFIYMANVQVNEPWIFSLVLFTTEPSLTGTYNEPVLYVGVASHDMHGKYAVSKSLANISSLVNERRQSSNFNYHWKWCMTLTSWTTDYLGQYYFY